MNKKLAMKYKRLEEVNNLLKSNPNAAIEEVLKWNKKQYGFIEIKSPYSFFRYFSLLLYDTEEAHKSEISELLKIGGKLSLVGTQGRTWITDFPTDNWVVSDPNELPQKPEYSKVTSKIDKEEFLRHVNKNGMDFHLIINGVDLFPLCITNVRNYDRVSMVEEIEYALYYGFLKNIENYYIIGRGIYVAVNVKLKNSTNSSEV